MVLNWASWLPSSKNDLYKTAWALGSQISSLEETKDFADLKLLVLGI